MIDEAVAEIGGLDAVVNVAGIQRRGFIDELNENYWDERLRINVKSWALISKYPVPHLKAAGGGSIVSTASLVDGGLSA